MLKHLIHIVEVKRSGEKIQFQIKLPQNAKKITGISITANPKIKYIGKIAPSYSVVTGWIWLRIPEKRDVFYTESVRRPLPLHNQVSHNLTPLDDFDNGTLWTQGAKEEFFAIEVPLKTVIVEGYYVNMLTQKVGMAAPVVDDPMLDPSLKPKPNRPTKPKPEQPQQPSADDRIGYKVHIYLTIEV